MDSAIELTLTGPNRFQKARDWIQRNSDTLIHTRPDDPLAQPRFFCGFPFLEHPSESTVFLPRWQVNTSKNNRTVAILNCTVAPNDDLDQQWQRYQTQLQQLQRWGRAEVYQSRSAVTQSWDESQFGDGQAFVDSVRRAIADIQNGHLRKIVLSHSLDLPLSAPTNPATLLHNLRQRYPHCYTFAISTGTGQTFLGASPECLAYVNRKGNQRYLHTEALAGSAPRGTTPAADKLLGSRLLNSKKDRHEHHLVTEFILERLQQLGIKIDILPSPQLRKLANIQHLHLPITTPFPAHLSPLDAVASLHPTPAVAGLPQAEAIARISQYESGDRGFYAGPIGWVDGQGQGEFAVGIRSALIMGDRAKLHAGAGIVVGSDPLKELAEVRLKLQALLTALM
ncbi:MAG: isochorismate synthase [Cyanobacteria bacterium P01_F01_bin.153]